ncbi:MAG: universal stress protein, partial [Chitinophagaceae bacterium]|nr:universal stress protein [Chitinophagaceae bacterium]
MQTILVPIDFSSTAFNAAVYALELGKQVQAQKVVLYHSYELPVMSDGGLAVPFMSNPNKFFLFTVPCLTGDPLLRTDGMFMNII